MNTQTQNKHEQHDQNRFERGSELLRRIDGKAGEKVVAPLLSVSSHGSNQ